VKRIIAERHIGLGRHEISTRLNRERVPTFRGGDGWHPSTIAALVRSTALIGIYQPRKADGTPDGDPIEGFYPRLISDDDFWRAQWGPDKDIRNERHLAYHRLPAAIDGRLQDFNDAQETVKSVLAALDRAIADRPNR
jgi:hypothetical protein